MNGKKTMKAWQMIVAVVLLAAMMITIFLPAFHINGKSFRKAVEKVVSGSQLDEAIGGLTGYSMDDLESEIDKALQEAEQENNVKVSSISVGNIMIKSADKFFGTDAEDADDEATASVKSGYNTGRIIFWIIYIAVILVIVLVILGFVLEWSKYIPLGITAGYSLVAAGIFGFLRFATPGMVAKSSAFSELFSQIPLSESLMSSMASKMIACFYGPAFLVAMIIAILSLVWSVVCMFVGGSEQPAQPPVNPPVPPQPPIDGVPRYDPDWAAKQRELEEKKRQEEIRRREEERLRREKEELERQKKELEEKMKAQQQPQMGQVVCIKGVAVGQGFSLPETAKIVVGKSRQNTNMLINSPMVSNVHCSIRYKAATNTYIVKDHSTNGTYVNGARIQKDVPMSFPAGTVLQLADGSNEIKLG
jgi:hypothetical protein